MRISDWSSDVCSSDLLKGKTIAVDGAGTTPYFVLMVMLHRNGLGPKDVQFATLAPNPAAQAFVAGQYDAASTYERSEERREGKGVSVRVDLGGRRIIQKKKNTTRDTAA